RMPGNPYSAPKSHTPPGRARQIRPLWRWGIGIVSLAGIVLMYVNYQVARSINGYYFHDSRVPLGALDIFAALAVVYLLLVAVFGRWRLFFRA
ncbi:hypothetical protein J5837_07690, partial [Pseudoxanthomonas helianthi]